MDLAIRDRVAVVLAASKGMGFAVASGLAREGCRVAICARRKTELERAAKTIEDETLNSMSPPVEGGMGSRASVEMYEVAVQVEA